MAVLNPRLLVGLALGVGIGAAVARRRAAVEPCCEKPAGRAACC